MASSAHFTAARVALTCQALGRANRAVEHPLQAPLSLVVAVLLCNRPGHRLQGRSPELSDLAPVSCCRIRHMQTGAGPACQP